MKRLQRTTAIILSAAMTATFAFSACSVDKDKLDSGINGLKDAVGELAPSDEAGTEAAAASEDTVAVSGDGEAVNAESVEESVMPTETEVIATPTPTPMPTPTPEPTPVPEPERVDFSELTEEVITDEITINDEAFSESYVNEDEVLYATFTGDRMLVAIDDSRQEYAINRILDGFYQEALGRYQSVIAEADATYALEQEIAYPCTVEVSYSYVENGKILSVVMSCKVYDEAEVYEDIFEVATFDLCSGQYINMNSITDDKDAILDVLLASLGEENEVTAEDVIDFWILAPQEGVEALISEVYILTEDGVIRCVVDVNNVSEYLNRYGRILYL